MSFPKINRRVKNCVGAALITLVFVLQATTPLIKVSSADAQQSGTPVNLLAYNTTYSAGLNTGSQTLTQVTCSAVYGTATESDDWIKKTTGITDFSILQNLLKYYNTGSNGTVPTKIGTAITSEFTKAQLQYFVDHYKHPIVTVEFKPATQPAGNNYPESNATCAQFALTPVSDHEWRGFQADQQNLSGLPTHKYISFSSNSNNTLTYYDSVTNGDGQRVQQEQTQITVEGTPARFSAGGTASNNTVQVSWISSSQIQIVDPASPHNGEIYTKSVWNEYGDYFLTYVPAFEKYVNAARTQQTLASSTQAHCSEDKPCLNSDNIAVDTNVPFIHVNKNISFMSHDTRRLQSAMNSLGNASATYYDFDSGGGVPSNLPNTGQHATFNSGYIDNSKIWFAYSAAQKAFVPLFTSGASYEQPFVGGTYKFISGNLYRGPGDGGCEGQIRYTGTPVSGQTMAVEWTLYGDKCQQPYGVLSGTAPLAKADDALFNSITNTISSDALAKTNSTTASAPKLDCEVSIINPLTWFMCPLIAAAQGLVGQLDDAINRQLFIKSDNIFTRSGDTKQSADGYYNAWLTFRGLGLGLIAIGGLVSIIAYALGFELFDAYTVRKVLPRLVIAVIGMSLSWYIMQYLVEFSNSLGLGIRSIIYAPFNSIQDAQITLGGGSQFVLGIVGGVAALSLGLIGLLSLGLTGVLAVAVGFGTIIVRNILVTFLIIVAPFAIACSILPNTRKAWDLWNDSFIKALLVFPIITAFIASGRVFALLASAGHNGGVATGLIAFVAYFAPYFLISTAFKLAGGVLRTVGGVAENKSNGVFGRLKKQRGERISTNFQKMGSGSRFQDSNVLARNFNRATVGAATGVKGRFGVGARGAEAVAIRRNVAAEQNFKSNAALQQLALNNDDATAVLALSGGSQRGAREAARDLFGTDSVRAERALNGAAAVGFSSQNAASAFVGMAQNKSRAIGDGDMAVVERGIARLANGNAAVANSTRGGFQYNSRNAGRFDLGDNDLEAAWARTNSYQLASSGTPHAVRAFADHWETEFTQGTQAYTAAAATGDRPAMQAAMQRLQRAKTAQIEMEGMKSVATVENADILNMSTIRMGDTERVFQGELFDRYGAIRDNRYPAPRPSADLMPTIERDLIDLDNQSRTAARVPEQYDPRRNH